MELIQSVQPASPAELPASVQEGMRVAEEKFQKANRTFAVKTTLLIGADAEEKVLNVRSVAGFMVGGQIRINAGQDTEEDAVIKKVMRGGIAVSASTFNGIQALTPQSSGAQQLELEDKLSYPHSDGERVGLMAPPVEVPPPVAPASPTPSNATVPAPAPRPKIVPPGVTPAAVPARRAVPPSDVTCSSGCSGHGQCSTTDGSCKCQSGWGLEDCSEMTCEKLGMCSGHGSCMNGTCACHEGWGTANCSAQGDGCPNQCSSHGICISGLCNCRKGWAGNDCSFDMGSECPNMCNGHGSCAAGVCQCFTGFYQDDCSAFCPFNCSFRGRCNQNGECVCKTGYGGEDCSVTCPNRCFGHGDCQNGTCVCFPGYGGPACSQRVHTKNFVTILGIALHGYTPIFLSLSVFLMVFVIIFGSIYAYNVFVCMLRGTDAVPFYNYFWWKWKTNFQLPSDMEKKMKGSR